MTLRIRATSRGGRRGFLIVGGGARVFLKTRAGAERYRQMMRDAESGKITRQEMWDMERGVFDADKLAAESAADLSLRARLQRVLGGRPS